MHESTFYSCFAYFIEVEITKISHIGALNSGYYNMQPRELALATP